MDRERKQRNTERETNDVRFVTACIICKKNILCLRGCCCGRCRGSICVCGTLPLAGAPVPSAWGGDQTNWPGDYPKNWRATIPGTGGRPPQELAGDYPKNWRATIPRTGGRPSQELAGDQPKEWWATNPRNGGRPTPGIASRCMVFPNGPDSQAASQPDRNQAT
jgi:hypothetical protein